MLNFLDVISKIRAPFHFTRLPQQLARRAVEDHGIGGRVATDYCTLVINH